MSTSKHNADELEDTISLTLSLMRSRFTWLTGIFQSVTEPALLGTQQSWKALGTFTTQLGPHLFETRFYHVTTPSSIASTSATSTKDEAEKDGKAESEANVDIEAVSVSDKGTTTPAEMPASLPPQNNDPPTDNKVNNDANNTFIQPSDVAFEFQDFPGQFYFLPEDSASETVRVGSETETLTSFSIPYKRNKSKNSSRQPKFIPMTMRIQRASKALNKCLDSHSVLERTTAIRNERQSRLVSMASGRSWENFVRKGGDKPSSLAIVKKGNEGANAKDEIPVSRLIGYRNKRRLSSASGANASLEGSAANISGANSESSGGKRGRRRVISSANGCERPPAIPTDTDASSALGQSEQATTQAAGRTSRSHTPQPIDEQKRPAPVYKKRGRPRGKKTTNPPTHRPSATSASASTSRPVNAPTAGGSSSSSGVRQCAYCNCRTTPMWRRGPGGAGTLCNACGVKWKQGKILQSATTT